MLASHLRFRGKAEFGVCRWRTRVGTRLGVLMAVAGLMLGTAAHGQDSAPATTNTPATDSIGPREL